MKFKFLAVLTFAVALPVMAQSAGAGMGAGSGAATGTGVGAGMGTGASTPSVGAPSATRPSSGAIDNVDQQRMEDSRTDPSSSSRTNGRSGLNSGRPSSTESTSSPGYTKP